MTPESVPSKREKEGFGRYSLNEYQDKQMTKIPILRYTSHTLRFILVFTGEVELVNFGWTSLFSTHFGGLVYPLGS